MNVNDKTFNISKEDILSELENSKYMGRYKIFNTYLEQGTDRWHRGYKSKFQQSLVDDKLYYFAYIKFYLDNDNKNALVAEKSSSYTVNSYGCDLGFYLYPQKGLAKKMVIRQQKAVVPNGISSYINYCRRKNKVIKRQLRLKNI